MPTGNGRPDAPAAGHGADGGTNEPAARDDAIGGDLGFATLAERRQRSLATNRARRAIKAEHQAERTLIQRAADLLTRVASSTPFLVVHALWFALWIALNEGLFGARPFDPFPFGLLTMVVSLEAIFLSIFVLMAQSRESQIAELREEITLQVNLRMEEEVTKTLQLVAGLYTRLGHRLGEDPELREMLQPLDADAIERNLIEQIREVTHPNRKRQPEGSLP
ncbi:MAG: DUF1003 domain-containing protein [Gemmatimonadaceae bacterium]